MLPKEALEWVVRFYQANLPAGSEREQTKWLREFEDFTTVVIDGWHEQPPRFSWKHGSGPVPPATIEHLRLFQHDVEQALQRATTPKAVYLFPVKYGASYNHELFYNPDEDDFPTTMHRPDAAVYLLKSLLLWNRINNLIRECPEWDKDQDANIKCRRFFLCQHRSDEKYCQDACANRATQRKKRKGA
jgi:hypothetical protein